MIASLAHLAALAAASLALITALGAPAGELQPSARLVLLTAVPCALAALFWPGVADGVARTLLRIAGWSLAVALLAAVFAAASGGDGTRIAGACGLLLLVLLVTHALAAGLELLLRPSAASHGAARDVAAWLATGALLMAGAAPLWLGPVAELGAASQPRVADAAVGASPLAHLAVASGNDLLRNQWFYQHSSLAGLPFAYPTPAVLVSAYLALLAAVLAPLAVLQRRAVRPAGAMPSTQESPP